MPDGLASERHLLERCRAGDPDAAEALVRQHEVALSRAVLRLVGDRPSTEDIVQEAFVRALGQVERLDPERGFRPWLYRVAINLARDHLRRRRFSEPRAEFEDGAAVLLAHIGADPESAAIAAERQRRLLAAVDRLSSRQREIVVLHHIEGLPFDEVSRILGIPVAYARVCALRARRRLAEWLAEGER